MYRFSPILMCLVCLLASKAQAVCENCYRVQIELGEATALQRDVERRVQENLEEMVALAELRDAIQSAIVQLLAESDHDTDSWRFRKLMLDFEWLNYSRLATDAGDTRFWLLGEKAAIDHTILLLVEEIIYDCEASAVG